MHEQNPLEKARCVLSQFNLSQDFWDETIDMVCYLVNKSLSIAIEMKTYIEIWSGTTTDYSIMKIIGYPAYAYVNDSKFETGAHKYIFLGYQYGMKGYSLWCIKSGSHKFIISRDVIFDKNAMFHF